MTHKQFEDGSAAEREQLDAVVAAEQLSLLTHKRFVLPINLLNAGIACAVFRKLYPLWLVALWMGLFFAVIFVRAAVQRRYRGAASSPERTRSWGRIFTLSAFATGCLWGLIGTVILITPDPEYQVFMVFVVGGMMAGGIVSNAAYLPSMLSFMLPTIVPAIVILFTRPGITHIEMGVMLTVFAIVLIGVGRSINHSIVETFRLRILQDGLVIKLRRSEAAMAEAQKIAHVGGLEFDAANDRFICTAETYRIFGVDQKTFKPTFETMIARVHPDDRAAVSKTFTEFVQTGKSTDLDCRIVMDDGSIKYMHSGSRTIVDSKDGPLRYFSTVQDVTESRIAENNLQFANILLKTEMEASPDGIVVVDENRKVISFNKRFADIWKIPLSDLTEGNDSVVLPRVSSSAKFPVEFEARVNYLYDHPGEDSHDEFETADGRYIDRYTGTLATPAGKQLGRVWFFRDITARRKAENALAYRDSLLRAMTIGTGILVKAESSELGMTEALRTLGESMRVDRVSVMQEGVGNASPPTLRYAWQTRDIAMPFDLSSFSVAPTDLGELLAWRAQLKSGKSSIAQRATSTGAIRAMMDHFHNESTLAVAIFVDGKLWGNLAADSCSVSREWSTSEIDTMKTFGDIAGALIVHNETMLSLEASEERFRVLTATAQDAIITTDKAGLINHWNLAAERMLGYSAEEAFGKQVHQFLAPASRRNEPDPGLTLEGGETGKTIELTVVRKDGTEIATELSVSGARLGGNWLSIGILRDITERKAAEEKLKFANILLKTEMEASPDGILVVDANRKIISFNQLFADIWKTPLSTLKVGNDFKVVAAGLELVKEPQKFSALVQHLYDHPKKTSHDEFEMKDGRSIDRYTVTLTTAAGENLGRVWFFRDITERKQAAAQALRMARFDVLTGLANRSVFVEALNLQIARAKRGEKGFALIYLDLDHFKDVNDTLGHPVGDALLLAVAVRLESNTRASDTVARFGGDEFAVVVADVAEPADVAILAEKLIHALDDPYSIQGNEIYSSASIGIDLYGSDACDAETLLSHADVALYRAKSEGRSGYRFFTDAMDADVRMQVSLGTELHEALNSGQLFLLYQPQVAVESGRITGVEALVRWRHPKRGILGPDIFIPVAEKIGMIVKLGHWVLLTACQQAKAWLDAGVPPVRTAVNLSALQFKSPIALETDISSILTETALPPPLLELELTESVLMNASREHNDIILRLRRIGVTIAIDDFGTGYSSLDYLRRFPADRIKIAQTFVRHLKTMPGDVAIVRATIGLAHEMGIMVIAEGVETVEQYDLLKGWGCAEVQGFYFSEPLTGEDVTLLLRAGGVLQPRADSVA
jgi:diguanylate cyclase (GGDEF)-like protein/PAS domain S-box-containing protein